MQEYQIDQLPVVTTNGQNVGSISDIVTMQVVYERREPSSVRVNSVMGRPYSQLDKNSEIDKAYKAFKLGTQMVVVTDEQKAIGVLTKFDIMTHLRETLSADDSAASKSKTLSGVKR